MLLRLKKVSFHLPVGLLVETQKKLPGDLRHIFNIVSIGSPLVVRMIFRLIVDFRFPLNAETHMFSDLAVYRLVTVKLL